jgi:hypothetical protein
VSAKKPENKIPESFLDDSFASGGDREQLLNKLRTKFERFCDRASIEEIEEATRIVRSLLAVRGLLPEQTCKKIN